MPRVLKGRGAVPPQGCLLCFALAVASSALGAPQLPQIAVESTTATPAVLVESDQIRRAETADLGRDGVTVESLNLRAGPATSFEGVALLESASRLRVLREEGEWLYVTTEQNAGWVHRDYVRLEPPTVPSSELESELGRLRAEQAEWNTERLELTRRVEKLEKDREDLQRALRDLRGEVEFTEEGVAGGGVRESRRERRIASAERQELGNLRARLDELGSERSDLNAALDAARAELGARLAAADLRRSEIERELERSRAELAELRRSRALAESSPETVAQLSAMQAQLETVQKQMQRELSASEQARESLWANVATLRAENSALRRQIESLGSTPAVSADRYEPAEGTVGQESLLEGRVTAWARAWSEQSFDTYIDFYSPDFMPADGMSLDAWRALRQSRLRRPDFIEVSIGSLSVEIIDSTHATTRFEQVYESNRYSDRVVKELSWVEQGGVWRIVSETLQSVR